MTTQTPADRARIARNQIEQAFAAVLLHRLSKIPLRLILEAIRTGSVKPITRSRFFRNALADTLEAATAPVESTVRTGYRSGAERVRGLSATEINRRARRFARAVGAPRAARLVQAVDSRNRATIRALIRWGANRYSKDPNVDNLRQLGREVKELIGLTPKQATRLRRLRYRMLEGGSSEAEVRRVLSEKSNRLRDLRAKYIADRGVTEAIGYGRHRAFVEAVDRGDLPESVKKAWRHQNDDRVRETHREQARRGPIPLDAEFELHGVLHPPSPDFGCRCWEDLVYPNEPTVAR